MSARSHESALQRLGAFVVEGAPPGLARTRAAAAVLDTIGVALAGACEPAARVVQRVIANDGGGACVVLGAHTRSSATGAALANGTAAHALDFDDMCFVSLAHPSCVLVPAALATAEVTGASGAALLDAYIVGFEIEGRLGRVMNPRHYQRGWHCTSTIGSIGAAAAASRLLGLDVAATGHALAIAASEASGLKENFGSMVKPLHAGLAARNGVLAAQLAKAGMTASERAFDGPQGLLHAMDSERESLSGELDDLGVRWEIVDTGITVKLYPSCAGTHPALDVILDLRRRHGFEAADVASVEVDVDAITPTVLLYDHPATGLEAKFSMRLCAATAIVHGHVDIASFEADGLRDPLVSAVMPRVVMRADASLDGIGAPLTQARVTMHLRDGRVLAARANGARGYPDRPASDEELSEKFLSCARRSLSDDSAMRALELLRHLDRVEDTSIVASRLIPV